MAFDLFPAGVPIRKRIFDLVLTFPLLLLFSPVMLVVALVILIFEGPPVLFVQPRPGYHNQIFNVIKFRHQLGRQIPPGCMVRRSLVFEAGCKNPGPLGLESPQARGHQPARPGYQ
jgi:hypothetical protein